MLIHTFSNNHDLSIDLMVNGRYYQSVQIREMSDSMHDFDVLIHDSQVGSIALTEIMIVELRSGPDWQSLTLVDLKKVVKECSDFPRPLALPTSSEMAQCKLFGCPYFDREDTNIRGERMEWLIAHDRCVRRVRAVLRDADITCIPCGSVFVVSNRSLAKRVLSRAGFLQSTVSAGALIETFSGSAVYLVEHSRNS